MEDILTFRRVKPLPAITAGIAATALLLLVILHIISPEFDPSARMVSEYALGQYPLILSLMFFCWGSSALLLAAFTRHHVNTKGGRIGIGFLLAGGAGALLAAFFDITHPLHGATALIGLPGLCIASMLLSISINKQYPYDKNSLRWKAHAIWISFVVMLVAVGIMMSGIAKAGGKITGEVVMLVGWPNRLLVFFSCFWIISAALYVKKKGK